MEKIDNEYYVSLEVAQLLKEAGFNWECRKIYYCYHEDGDTWELGENYMNHRHILEVDDRLLTPTLDVVQRWLREVKGFEEFVGFTKHDFGNGNEKAYFYDCYEIPENEDAFEHFDDIYYHSYEETQEAGIKKALELILEKRE